MSQAPATMEMPSIDEERPSAAGAVFKRRAPRSRRKKRHNMKKDVSWRDLKGLTFEEIECLEAEEEARTRAAAQQLDSFGEVGDDGAAATPRCCACLRGDAAAPAGAAAAPKPAGGDVEAAASTPKTKSDAEAYLDEFEGGGGGEPREETWSEDDDDDYYSSESDDDDDGDDDHDASRHTAGEWWSVAIGGIANKLGGVVQSVKKAAKDAVKERGEQWISTLLDNFFNTASASPSASSGPGTPCPPRSARARRAARTPRPLRPTRPGRPPRASPRAPPLKTSAAPRGTPRAGP